MPVKPSSIASQIASGLTSNSTIRRLDMSRVKLKKAEKFNEENYAKTKEKILILEDLVGYRSYPSRSTPAVDIPDPISLKLEFTYNFFTPDERLRGVLSPEDQIINLKTSTENQVLYEATNERLPRYVRLSFQPPKFLNSR